MDFCEGFETSNKFIEASNEYSSKIAKRNLEMAYNWAWYLLDAFNINSNSATTSSSRPYYRLGTDTKVTKCPFININPTKSEVGVKVHIVVEANDARLYKFDDSNWEVSERTTRYGPEHKTFTTSLSNDLDFHSMLDEIVLLGFKNISLTKDRKISSPTDIECDRYSKTQYQSKAKLVEIFLNEKRLSNHFGSWLSLEGYDKIFPERRKKDSNDRFDYTFVKKEQANELNFLAELKTAKRDPGTVKNCIRLALGQLLDYAFYGNRVNNFNQLWIVVDMVPVKDDIDFIRVLSKTFNLPLRLVFQKSGNNFEIVK